MKDFDIYKAKSGHYVCTQDGRDVRIICYDGKVVGGMPIVALVADSEEYPDESVIIYDRYGNPHGYPDNYKLKMKTIHKKGWINIIINEDFRISESFIFSDEQKAIKYGSTSDGYKGTIQIEWEEEIKLDTNKK